MEGLPGDRRPQQLGVEHLCQQLEDLLHHFRRQHCQGVEEEEEEALPQVCPQAHPLRTQRPGVLHRRHQQAEARHWILRQDCQALEEEEEGTGQVNKKVKVKRRRNVIKIFFKVGSKNKKRVQNL